MATLLQQSLTLKEKNEKANDQTAVNKHLNHFSKHSRNVIIPNCTGKLNECSTRETVMDVYSSLMLIILQSIFMFLHFFLFSFFIFHFLLFDSWTRFSNFFFLALSLLS